MARPSLTEYAGKNVVLPGPRRTVTHWMQERPDVLAEITANKDTVSPMTMYRWLREAWEFEFATTTWLSWFRENIRGV